MPKERPIAIPFWLGSMLSDHLLSRGGSDHDYFFASPEGTTATGGGEYGSRLSVESLALLEVEGNVAADLGAESVDLYGSRTPGSAR